MGVDALRQLPQGIGGRSISIRSVLTSLLCAYWVLLGLSTLLGKSPLFDWTTAILTSTLCFVLVTFLQIARNRAFAQAVVIAFFFLVFVLPRIFQYQVLPDLIEFPYGDPNLQDINDGLTYLLFGTICIIAGILSVEGLISEGRRRSRSSPKILNFSPLVIVIVFAVFLAVEAFITLWLGVGVFGKFRADSSNTLNQLARMVFGIDTAFFIAVAALIISGNSSRRLFWVLALLSVYVMYLAMTGSRAGGQRVLTMLLLILVCFRGNFRLLLRNYLIVSLLFVLGLGLALFPVASQARNYLIARRFEQTSTTDVLNALDMSSFEDGLSLFSRPQRFAATVLNRLGAVDYAIVVLAEPGDEVAKETYMSVDYALKSVVNALAPGTAFPEAELSTSRAPSVIYRGQNVSHLSWYFSEYWTAWGVAYLLFGWWGGLMALFVTGMLIAMFYAIVLRWSGRWRYYFGPVALLMVSLNVYLSMGLDHTITTAVIAFVQTAAVVAGLVIVHRSIRKSHRLMEAVRLQWQGLSREPIP